MPKRRRSNPLRFIPKPSVVRAELDEVEKTAKRLRILLETSEQIQRAGGPDAINNLPLPRNGEIRCQ